MNRVTVAAVLAGAVLLAGGWLVIWDGRDGQSLIARGGYPKLAAIADTTSARIVAFGDLMLDRYVRLDIERYGQDYPLAHIAPIIEGSDLVVANAEGVFTANPSVSIDATSTLRFTFEPAMLPVLKAQGIGILSQANNHADDFGNSGLLQSQQALIAAGIATFGDPGNLKPGPYITTIRSQRIAFIGYNEFTGGGDARVLAAIAQSKALGAFVIVYPHWGVEYSQGVTALQRQEAHRFIDAGADAVLGSHPHVIEPVETYRSKLIAYSMGNFIFDQAQSGPTAEGLAIGISLATGSVSYHFVPFSILHAQAVPMSESGKSAALAAIASSTLAALGTIPPGLTGGTLTLPR